MKEKIVRISLIAVIAVSLMWILLLLMNKKPLTGNIHPEDLTDLPITEMQIDEPIRNIGQVSEDSIIRIDFSIHNIGEKVLKITDVDPDCSCTDFSLSLDTINPGCCAILTLIVDTSHKYGENIINVVVNANTAEKLHIIRLKFDVEPHSSDCALEKRIFIEEPEIMSAPVKFGTQQQFTVCIVNGSESELNIFDYFVSCSCIKFELPDNNIVNPGDRLYLTGIYNAEKKGSHTYSFGFRSDLKSDLTAKLRVHVVD